MLDQKDTVGAPVFRTGVEDDERSVHILDCTLRDGSYAVDHFFTPRDTAILVEALSIAGLRFIEVGHGLGLGASESGKGGRRGENMDCIRAAKSVAGDARIGVFFIPGIGRESDLKQAAAVGLDFVRIGYDATEIEKAFPSVKIAKDLGLMVCVNLMKTYALSPEEFGARAPSIANAGADAVYIVDSAGGMMPDEVSKYVIEARKTTPVNLGFHGHNNLQLATANSIAAFKAGAGMIDGSLYGLGRSAGNAPTETLVAALEMENHHTGVDLFILMEAAEKHVHPLMNNIRLHDMTSVACGFGKFHSSFLSKVEHAAKVNGVDVRRLIVKTGQSNPVKVDEAMLAGLARSIPKPHPGGTMPRALADFTNERFGPEQIRREPDSIREMLLALQSNAAKKRIEIALDLTPSADNDEETLLCEVLGELDWAVVGRITYGGWPGFGQALELAADMHPRILLDIGSHSWADPNEALRLIHQIISNPPAILYDSRRLTSEYLLDVLLNTPRRERPAELLLLGNLPEMAGRWDELAGVYRTLYRAGGEGGAPGLIPLPLREDLRTLDIRPSVILMTRKPHPDERSALSMLGSSAEAVLLWSREAPSAEEAAGFFERPAIVLNLFRSYEHLLRRNQ